MRNLLLCSVLGLAAIAACAKSSDAPAAATADKAAIAALPTVSPDECDQQLAKGAQAVDANGESTRKRMGVVPGAVLLTDSSSFAVSELPADKSKPLVFYCANTMCGASHEAAGRALTAGYTNVKVMPEGIAGWVKAGKKTQSILADPSALRLLQDVTTAASAFDLLMRRYRDRRPLMLRFRLVGLLVLAPIATAAAPAQPGFAVHASEAITTAIPRPVALQLGESELWRQAFIRCTAPPSLVLGGWPSPAVYPLRVGELTVEPGMDVKSPSVALTARFQCGVADAPDSRAAPREREARDCRARGERRAGRDRGAGQRARAGSGQSRPSRSASRSRAARSRARSWPSTSPGARMSRWLGSPAFWRAKMACGCCATARSGSPPRRRSISIPPITAT